MQFLQPLAKPSSPVLQQGFVGHQKLLFDDESAADPLADSSSVAGHFHQILQRKGIVDF